jgi:hypothetical protein
MYGRLHPIRKTPKTIDLSSRISHPREVVDEQHDLQALVLARPTNKMCLLRTDDATRLSIS